MALAKGEKRKKTKKKMNLNSDLTGDKDPCTEPVYAEYMVVPCPKY